MNYVICAVNCLLFQNCTSNSLFMNVIQDFCLLFTESFNMWIFS